MTATAGSLPNFTDRVLRLLERVEHRIAKSDFEREEVFRLRYDAYARNGLLTSRTDGRLFDARYDTVENAWITTTFIDGELAGSVRVNVGGGVDANLPSLRVYPDVVAPRLSAGQIAVEYTRLAAKLSLSSAHPELAYIIMRPGFMAGDHFDADFAIASPRLEHMPFYKRIFGAVLWCPPRDYPGLTAKFGCMGADFRLARKNIERRFPFYKSTPIEREALFGPCGVELDFAFRPMNLTGRGTLTAELSTV